MTVDGEKDKISKASQCRSGIVAVEDNSSHAIGSTHQSGKKTRFE
jgi:hypothetical protein